MQPFAQVLGSVLTSLLVVGVAAPKQVWGQPITPAPDGTGTVITPNGDRIDITSGTLGGDRTNLFHSFETFGLSEGQIANFLSNPEIRNILGRVVGGDASIINGLIQVTGGNSNLFLMNPAGIVFGSGASLNVPASFTATTATGIGFGGDNWLNAFGNNNYQNLIGTPSTFAFDNAQAGNIVNAADLAVGDGQNLRLLGGSVTNTGKVTAPSGNIAIASVPGENLLRISQPGHLLSLEIAPPRDNQGQLQAIALVDLPGLLTGNNGHVVNQGQISTKGSTQGGNIQIAGRVVYNLGQITADGAKGGAIAIQTQNLLDSGIISASGNDGKGGEIFVNYTGTLIQTASANTSAKGTSEGGAIAFYGTENTVLTISGSLEATGEVGGSVHLFAQDIRLLAANVNVSGNSGGGEILVGGDFQGNPLNPFQGENPPNLPYQEGSSISPPFQGELGGIANAQNTLVNHASTLRADALTEGNAGKVIVWSDQLTQFAGTIQARGGAVSGDGGFVEVSGKDTLAMAGIVEAGAVNGEAGTLLLDPKNIVIDEIDTTGQFPQFDLIDRNAGGGTGFGTDSVPLITGNVVVTKPGDNFAAENAGAVYLYDGATGGLISYLTGSQPGDEVGSGVVALTNGNYVVHSRNWDNGMVVNAGAVTWGNGSTGVTGVVSIANSLVGSRSGVVALTNGNYVVNSPDWDNGTVVNAGAATWGNGSTGVTGVVSIANSLVGSRANDRVGDGGMVALTNGNYVNYVVSSPDWDNGTVVNAGATTWGNGSTGVTGVVSIANSLVGSRANDSVGDGGEIRLSSGDDITTGILSSLSNSSGGEITLQATGNITTISIFSSGENGNGGSIRLDSGGNITPGILQASGNDTGGNITLQSTGNITSNSLLSSGGNGNGGVINLNSGGSINIINDRLTNLSGITSLSSNGNGGDIRLNAADSINTGSLPVFSTSAVGNGGNITLNAVTGDIEVAGINTEGGGTGGNVDITTTQFFRATDSFRNLNDTTASISTSGVSGGGTIIIRHGGRGVTPFKVGDAGTNGTYGAITTGNLLRSQTISPTVSFLNTHTQDGIQIISVPGQTLPPPLPPPASLRPSDSDGSPQDTLAALVGDIVGVKTSVNQDPLTGNSSYAWQIPGVGSLDTGQINLANLLAQGNLNNALSEIDDLFESEYEEYLGENIAGEKVSVESIRNTLNTIKDETGTNPVIIYAISLPEQLELVLVLPEGPPIRKVISAANATALQQTLTEFRASVTNVQRPKAYLNSAQKLYSWMIAPVESQLKSLGIDTLIFCMDAGLRTIPMAALHDGKQFLVEKYSLGSIPSVSLTNSRYKAVKDTRVLAMGASQFQQLDPLPAVPEELKAITQQFGSEKYFLNEEFTLTSLKNQRQQQPIEIIHLATHADFQPGDASNSYIQLWDNQLKLDQLRQLGWNQPPKIELLVLSACRTAVGDAQVELGFAGLAVQAGVKSALASLWYVSDGGTLALMSEFYRQLNQPDVTIKAEALRRAQIAMLRGQLQLESGQLRGLGVVGTIPLPPELPENQDFSHPYYWAAFTIIGSPW
jgi:filamentous hemagglutinin family protein